MSQAENETATKPVERTGGQLKDQIRMAPDFDDQPEDIARAFGMIDDPE